MSSSLPPSVSASSATPQRIEALVRRVVARIARGEDPCLDLPGSPPLCGGLGFAGARGLASMLRVQRSAYELTTSARTATVREVYYLHAEYFSGQDESNASIARSCDVLGVARHELGILAASRGWYAGLLLEREEPTAEDDAPEAVSDAALPSAHKRLRAATLTRVCRGPPRPIPGDAVYAASAPPPRFGGGRYLADGAHFILIVEKECVYRRLVEDVVWAHVPCILITGSGMPDLATRAFTYQLARDLCVGRCAVRGEPQVSTLQYAGCCGRRAVVGGLALGRGGASRILTHSPPAPPSPPHPQPPPRLHSYGLESVWARHLPLLLQRLSLHG